MARRKTDRRTGTAAKAKAPKSTAKAKTKAADAPKRRPGRPPKHGRVGDDVDARFPNARVIKRYGNRRLYDARLSRVTTLEEIAELVRRGEDVRVVDGDTGEDLTRRILTQIILEEQNRRQLELLPVELLQRIIAARNDVAKEWIEQAMSGLTRFITQSAQQVKSATSAAASLWPWATSFGGPQTAAAPGTDGDDDAVRRELEELKRKMADLASRVGRR